MNDLFRFYWFCLTLFIGLKLVVWLLLLKFVCLAWSGLRRSSLYFCSQMEGCLLEVSLLESFSYHYQQRKNLFGKSSNFKVSFPIFWKLRKYSKEYFLLFIPVSACLSPFKWFFPHVGRDGYFFVNKTWIWRVFRQDFIGVIRGLG